MEVGVGYLSCYRIKSYVTLWTNSLLSLSLSP